MEFGVACKEKSGFQHPVIFPPSASHCDVPLYAAVSGVGVWVLERTIWFDITLGCAEFCCQWAVAAADLGKWARRVQIFKFPYNYLP